MQSFIERGVGGDWNFPPKLLLLSPNRIEVSPLECFRINLGAPTFLISGWRQASRHPYWGVLKSPPPPTHQIQNPLLVRKHCPFADHRFLLIRWDTSAIFTLTFFRASFLSLALSISCTLPWTRRTNTFSLHRVSRLRILTSPSPYLYREIGDNHKITLK